MLSNYRTLSLSGSSIETFNEEDEGRGGGGGRDGGGRGGGGGGGGGRMAAVASAALTSLPAPIAAAALNATSTAKRALQANTWAFPLYYEFVKLNLKL